MTGRQTGHPSLIYIWTITFISFKPFKVHVELHPPWPGVTSCTILPIILLNLILDLPLIQSLPHTQTFYVHYSKWSLLLARWGITIHRTINNHTLSVHLHSRKKAFFWCPPNNWLPIVYLRSLNCRQLTSPVFTFKQDSNINDKISNDKAARGESILTSNIDWDNLGHEEEILYLVQPHWNNLLQTTRDPLPMKPSHANTGIACPLLLNSCHPAVAMAPSLLKHQMSTLLNRLLESC